MKSFKNIHDREALIERLEHLHAKETNGCGSCVKELLYGIHNALLGVAEAIATWNLDKQDDWCRKKNIEVHSFTDGHCVPCPFNTFFWSGQNYLQKMLSDLDFVGDIPEAISFLGPTPYHRNPFLLTLDIDQLAWGGNIMAESKVWKDVNAPRIRRSAFVILLDDYNRNRRPSSYVPSGNGSERSYAMEFWKFHPPPLVSEDLSSYISMNDPPATIAITVCCAHLVLGSLDSDVTDKLVHLTKTIILNIFRQPFNGLLYKARMYNPLRQTEVNKSAIKLVHPFIMNEKIDPLAGGASDQIIHLCKWMRSLVCGWLTKKLLHHFLE